MSLKWKKTDEVVTSLDEAHAKAKEMTVCLFCKEFPVMTTAAYALDTMQLPASYSDVKNPLVVVGICEGCFESYDDEEVLNEAVLEKIGHAIVQLNQDEETPQ